MKKYKQISRKIHKNGNIQKNNFMQEDPVASIQQTRQPVQTKKPREAKANQASNRHNNKRNQAQKNMYWLWTQAKEAKRAKEEKLN